MSPAAASRRTAAKKKHMAAGGVLVGEVDGPDAERDDDGGSDGADEKCGEVKPAYALTAAGEPHRGDHV
jgi:hypothetical protein